MWATTRPRSPSSWRRSISTGTIVPTGYDASGHPTFQVLASGIKFPEQGTYNINVTITDDDHDLPATPPVPRQSTSTTSVIFVADAPIFGSPVVIANGVEGQAVSDTFSKQYPGLGALVATFTDADTGGHVGDYSATINWGDTTATVPGTVVADPNIPGQFDVLGNHTFAEDGINTVKVSITDDDHDVGGLTPQSTTVVSSIVTVLDAPLTAGATVAVANQTEGATFTVPVATFTDADKGGIPGDYIVTIDWGDATGPQPGTVVPTGVTKDGATFQVLGTHKYSEESPMLPGGSPYKVTISITDADGHLVPPPVVPRSSAAATTTITVKDAGISLTPAAVGGVEGQSSLITVATLTDGDGINTTTSDYLGTIAWSDGTTSQAIFTNALDGKGNIIPAVFKVQGFHTFAEEGVSLATVKVWDTDFVRNGIAGTPADTISAFAQQQVPVTIGDAPLTSIGTPVTISNTPTGAPIVEGQPTGSVVVATFQDGNPNAPLSDFPSSNVTITWGDGTTSAGTVQPGGGPGQFNVFGTHSYTEEGTFTTKVVIKDVGGSSTTATNTSFSVADAPLSPVSNPLTIQAITNVNTGPKIAGTFLDQDPNGGSGVGPQPDYVATIFWGDGGSSTATGFAVQSVSAAGAVINVIGNHTYAFKGSYSIFALVTDVDGGSTVTPRSTTFTFNVTAIVTDPPAAPSTPGAASLSSSSISAGAFSNVGVNPLVTTTSSVTSSTSNAASNAAVDQALSSFVNNNVVAGSKVIPVTTYVVKKPGITGSLLN